MSQQNVNQLLQNAQEEGALSQAAVNVLTVVDLGAQIQAGLGVSVDDVHASEVVLVTMMPDDSGSIESAGNVQVIIDGHNMVLDALLESKQDDSILVHNRYLNGKVLYPYCSLRQAVRMSNGNYNQFFGTPLYDNSIILLATVLAKTQEFADNGVPVRTVSLIITDGADMGSRRAEAKDVKKVVENMLRCENHVVATMGISDGYTDFRQVFREMGIQDKWILTPGNTKSEIRKAFLLFSQSAVRASQTAGTFSQTVLAGFGN
ncbi:MAG: hypothetical protein V1655_02220 [bacterium]